MNVDISPFHPDVRPGAGEQDFFSGNGLQGFFVGVQAQVLVARNLDVARLRSGRYAGR
jgi:hypothetical protein